MNCDDVRALSSEHLDGTLVGARDLALRAHLDACPLCRAELASLRTALATLALPASLPTPSEHVADVMAAVRRASAAAEEPRRRRVVPWLVVASHVAAAAIGAGVLFLLLERGAVTERAGLVADGSGGGDGGAGTPTAPVTEPLAPPVQERAAAPDTDALRRVVIDVAALEAGLARLLDRAERRADAALAAARSAAERERLRLDARLARAAEGLAFAFERGAAGLEALAASDARERRLADELAALSERAYGLERELALERAAAPEAGSPTAFADAGARVGTGEWSAAGTGAAATDPARGPVAIARDAGGIVLTLRGELDEVVPALVAQLDSPEADVRLAVERRLVALARSLGVAPPGDAGASDEPPWWRSDRGRVADAYDRAGAPETSDTAAWRAWWDRTRVRAVDTPRP
jgi:hypothetical protein